MKDFDRRYAPDQLLDKAHCSGMDPNIFFPEKYERTVIAKAVCRGCPVRVQCLNYAIHNKEIWGVWGGMAPRERKRLERMGRLAV